MKPLDRVSEQYSALGNVAGSGVKRILGKPPLDSLAVVIREAVQNSWDARIRDSAEQLRILLRFRNLVPEEAEVLRTSLADLPVEAEVGRRLQQLLTHRAPITIMEIADYGTVGLSGPESPQFDTGQDEKTHFVDFIRNIGKEHSEVDGGTYGFGKSSFYTLSRVSTIYVDTRSTDAGTPVQRIMFAALGSRFTAEVDGIDTNFTGRHWWGESSSPDSISPLTGVTAEAYRNGLGLPERPDGASGTTIGVLMPDLPGSADDPDFINEIRRIILANFWTKMVPDSSGKQAIDFQLEINGEIHTIPDPRSFSPLKVFAAALELARTRDTGRSQVAEIMTGGRPRVLLGHVGFMPARVIPRPKGLADGMGDNWSDAAGAFLFRNEPVHHYAVMRSGELVVRYFEGRAHASPDVEWAGVFITSDDPDVERAFASSEPPAHDDWNHQGMGGEPGRYVRAGLREVRRAFDRFITPNTPSADSEISLGVSSARLGRLLPGLAVAGRSERDPLKKTTRAPRKGRFLPATFSGYGEHEGESVLIFRTGWRPGKGSGRTAMLRVVPKVLLEGKPADLAEVPDGFQMPEVLALRADSANFEVLGSDSARFDPAIEFDMTVKLTHVDDLAVSMDVTHDEFE